MGFQKGNQLWRISNPCKPKRYQPEELFQKAQDYLEWCIDNPIAIQVVAGKDAKKVNTDAMHAPTIMEFCVYANISTSTWYLYAKTPAYSDICSHITNVFFAICFSGAAANALNPNIMARHLGLVDKKELKTEDTQKVVFYTPDNGRAITQRAEDQENTHDIPYEDLSVPREKELDLPPLNSETQL